MKPRCLLLAGAAVFLAGSAATSRAVDVSLQAEIRLGRALPPAPPIVEIIEPVGPKGPPPWAPAHGFRRNRDYYYYPDARVYYRPADRQWFYLEGGAWRVGAQLPASVGIDFGRSVTLTMETDRPFEQHAHVVTYYPANYFSKVKIKGRPDKERGAEKSFAREAQPAHGADGRDDKGKGKGKGRNH
jgi:hypothetical protein